MATMLQTPGVEDIHFLRTRKMAGSVFIDVHVITLPKISVSEGHFIGENLRDAVKKEHLHVVDVTVHIDPEDDEIRHNKPLPEWPARKILVYMLKQALQKHALICQENSIIIHYLLRGIELEVVVQAAKNTKDLNTVVDQVLLDLQHTESQISKLTFVQKIESKIE